MWRGKRPVQGSRVSDDEHRLVQMGNVLLTRAQHEERPTGADDWYVHVLNALSDAILVVDKDCIVRFMNHSYTRLKGLRPEDAIGRPLEQVRPASLLPEVVKSGRPKRNIPRRTGDMEYLVDVLPIKVGDEVIGGITVSKDVTQARELARKVSQLEMTMKQAQRAKYTFSDLLGKSPQLLKLVDRAKRAARSNSSVLITGESGTGKELLAHAIHNESERRYGPFVVVNCAAIPSELLESELFGYESGAFTDARRGGKLGLFEVADTGTIFLDEIGDMALPLQAKVLRILQDRKLRRIGSTREIDVDVRVIAATNKQLEEMISKGEFREDLYYRLNVVPIHLPPLRERKEDIPILIEHLIRKYSPGQQIDISCEALEMLTDYSWPGNIRELENAIEFILGMMDGDRILPEHIPPKIRGAIRPGNREPMPVTLKEILCNAEKEAISKAIATYGADTRGKKSAAKALGISLATLYNKIKLYNL